MRGRHERRRRHWHWPALVVVTLVGFITLVVPAFVPLASTAAPPTAGSGGPAQQDETDPGVIAAPVAVPHLPAPMPAPLPMPRPVPTDLAAPDVPPGVVGAHDGRLWLDDRPYRFTGVNAYQLATNFSVNVGCGNQVRDLDGLFASLRPDSMVRFWAFQGQGYNKHTRRLDFTALDRVVRAAERHDQRLVFTLGEQAGVCDDGHWKDMAWYQGGYTQVFDDAGRGQAVSYWDWLHLVVDRYKDSPAVGMWEVLNEPQVADCPSPYTGVACYGQAYCPPMQAEALRDFFTTVGQEIKRIDPVHLVSSGTLAHGECGVWEQYFQMVHESPGIDVASVHDYDPAPLTDLVDRHLARARAVNKPVVFGEVGTDAGGSSCLTQTERATAMRDKITKMGGHFEVSGFLLWQWVEQREPEGRSCTLQITPSDPVLDVLREHPLAGRSETKLPPV